MIVLAQKKFRRWPSGVVGMFLGLNILLALVVTVSPPSSSAAGLCDGNYPCYTTAACTKAGGDFAACPQKCDGSSNHGFCYVRQSPIPLTINIAGKSTVLDIGQYVELVYRYAVYVAGIFAAVMFMIGGLQWLTAGGNTSSIGTAKKRIVDASIGLALTLFAWLILNTINPSLVRLQMPRIPMVQKQNFVACDQFRMQVPCGRPFGLKEKENAPDTGSATELYEICSVDDEDAITTACTGMSCSLAGSQDGLNTCQIGGSSDGEEASSSSESSADSSSDDPTAEASAPVTPYQCVRCQQWAEECMGIGTNSSCCGGYCRISRSSVGDQAVRELALQAQEYSGGQIAAIMADRNGAQGMCSNGENGSPCAVDVECFGGYCVDTSGSRAGGICMNGSVGASCTDDDECQVGLACITMTGYNLCTVPQVGGPCEDNDDCPERSRCNDSRCGFPGGYDVAATPCSSDSDCENADGGRKICNTEQEINGEGYCTAGGPGTPCDNNVNVGDSICNKRVDEEGSVRTGARGACFDISVWSGGGICVEGKDGNGCDTDADCRVQAGSYTAKCRDHGASLSTLFNGGICSFGDEPNDPCFKASGDSGRGTCAPGLTCDDASQTCLPTEN